MLHCNLRGVERTVQVHTHHAMPFVIGHGNKTLGFAANACVHETRVDSTKGIQSCGKRFSDLLLVTHIADEVSNCDAHVLKFGSGRAVLLGRCAPDGDVRALAGQPSSHPEPNSAISSGDESHRARQVK